MKKIISFLLTFTFLLSLLAFDVSADVQSDYNVKISFPKEALPGDVLDVKVDITDIVYPEFDEGKGIFGVSVFLYYDSNFLQPITDSFQGVAPSGWDKFDGTATQGIWALYTLFDGFLSNGAVNDGDISFTVSFLVKSFGEEVTTKLFVDGCECTGYDSDSFLKFGHYNSSASTTEILKIKKPDILKPMGDDFIIDKENGIIYSSTPALSYDKFVSYFERIDGELTIKGTVYEVTSENQKFIPNGAIISIYNEYTNRTYNFVYYLLGDCDCNGVVNLSDLVVLKTTIVKKIPTEGYVKYSMEFEKDGFIRLADYLRLKMYIKNLILK